MGEITMATTAPLSRTPVHLWIVGILSLLWNAFGAYDYIMSQTRNMDYLGSLAPSPEATREMVAMLDAFPTWMEFFWAIGVWGAVAGSVLLLLRNRYAVHAFAASLVGMVVGMLYQATAIDQPEWMTAGAMSVMPYVIILIGIGLLLYARAMAKKGVLR